MEGTVFIINNRFTVDRFSNEVFDESANQKSRLEPRLMRLLCLLADNNGNVVKRELIVKEIWDDYPGANEGLNQAVSFLRKLLADDHKQVIKTIPKEGYSFNAIISQKSDALPLSKRKYRLTMVAGCVLLLVLVFMAGWYYAKREVPTGSKKELFEKDAAEMGRKDSAHQAEQMRKYSVKDTMGPAAKGDSVRSEK